VLEAGGDEEHDSNQEAPGSEDRGKTSSSESERNGGVEKEKDNGSAVKGWMDVWLDGQGARVENLGRMPSGRSVQSPRSLEPEKDLCMASRMWAKTGWCRRFKDLLTACHVDYGLLRTRHAFAKEARRPCRVAGEWIVLHHCRRTQ
jgi:hypothetical protein